ncbi:MAG: CHAT domain-containing protein [Candidatus Thiodiazotropha taylori]|nr:CHAT domain-containing protein [Candidatus Thiodiazotropha endolucinida]MCW4230970.1 CHAT domain-containing protein [Candidatus Thiodiazotropha taylori]
MYNKLPTILLFLLFFCLIFPHFAFGQMPFRCETGSDHELEAAIWTHNQHVYRLERKFNDIWYFQGELPEGAVTQMKLEDIHEFLAALKHRTPAILFYAYDDGHLCTWMVDGDQVSGHVANVEPGELKTLQLDFSSALRLRGRSSSRRAESRDLIPEATHQEPMPSLEAMISTASELFLPKSISDALIAKKVDTLIVIPVTIAVGPPDVTRKEEFVAALGTIPFSVLTVGDGPLVESMSVLVAPGFAYLDQPPRVARRSFGKAIVIGDPVAHRDPEWKFSPLPGARNEAEVVAETVGVTALIGEHATKKNLFSLMESRAQSAELIHFATHGISDSKNPLDGSFLLLSDGPDVSDGRLLAREIQKFSLSNCPLVVMSACQTGLGKDFDVGTIGLARAWQYAGASSVVMSLWNVDDEATFELMTEFIRLSESMPHDRALQHAMQHVRSKRSDPYFWAGFSIFGLPESDAVASETASLGCGPGI